MALGPGLEHLLTMTRVMSYEPLTDNIRIFTLFSIDESLILHNSFIEMPTTQHHPIVLAPAGGLAYPKRLLRRTTSTCDVQDTRDHGKQNDIFFLAHEEEARTKIITPDPKQAANKPANPAWLLHTT